MATTLDWPIGTLNKPTTKISANLIKHFESTLLNVVQINTI